MTGLLRRLIAPLAALGVLVTLMGGAFAQDSTPTELMTAANERYARGEYAEAAQQYEALIYRGYADTAIYFNLGNTYSQGGDLGRAILNYLRAEELSPRDPDIRVNLDLTRGRTIDRIEAERDCDSQFLVAALVALASNSHRLSIPRYLVVWSFTALCLSTPPTSSVRRALMRPDQPGTGKRRSEELLEGSWRAHRNADGAPTAHRGAGTPGIRPPCGPGAVPKLATPSPG